MYWRHVTRYCVDVSYLNPSCCPWCVRLSVRPLSTGSRSIAAILLYGYSARTTLSAGRTRTTPSEPTPNRTFGPAELFHLLRTYALVVLEVTASVYNRVKVTKPLITIYRICYELVT